MPLYQENAAQNRINLVNDLSENLRSNISILHGEAEWFVGTYGCKERLSYIAMIPDYKSKLNCLSSIAFGEIIQL